jgi:hypothetical protein
MYPVRDRPALPTDAEHVFSEDIDDALREVDELCESWKNRLSVKNLALSERYCKAKPNSVLSSYPSARRRR